MTKPTVLKFETGFYVVDRFGGTVWLESADELWRLIVDLREATVPQWTEKKDLKFVQRKKADGGPAQSGPH